MGPISFELVGIDEDIPGDAAMRFEPSRGMCRRKRAQRQKKNLSIKLDPDEPGQDHRQRKTQGLGQMEQVVDQQQRQQSSGG